MFKALLLTEKDGKVTPQITQLDEERLPEGDVTVRVQTASSRSTAPAASRPRAHPIGATGISMHVLTAMQLKGEAGAM